MTSRNVLGDDLEPCGVDPVTGFYRDGACTSGPEDRGSHTVCAGDGQIQVVASRDAAGNAIIAFHDNGPGVPRRYEAAIWERFNRGVHRLDAKIPGSGIGLSIARSLIEAHGGTIRYQRSERLGGACFTISLPGAATATPSIAEPETHAA